MSSFTVLGDPIPKARPRFVNGRTHTDPKTTRAEQLVVMAARRAKVKPLEGPLVLWLEFHRRTHIRVDLDNLAKTVMDALNGIAWEDDAQVVELRARKVLGSPAPRTEVRVESAIALVEPTQEFINAWHQVHEVGQGNG